MEPDAMTVSVLTALRAITIGALAGSVVAWSWPVSQRPAPVPLLTEVVAPDSAVVPGLPGNADSIVQHNPFSVTRRPPREREMLAALDTFPEALPVGDGDSLSPDAAVAGFDAAPVPQLLGIVVGPAGPRALLRLDATKARAALFGVGDGTNGWRVAAIAATSVTLDGPAGRQVVSLSSRSGSP
jgi:hypothetical protein